jgi:hypothetical protein
LQSNKYIFSDLSFSGSSALSSSSHSVTSERALRLPSSPRILRPTIADSLSTPKPMKPLLPKPPLTSMLVLSESRMQKMLVNCAQMLVEVMNVQQAPIFRLIRRLQRNSSNVAVKEALSMLKERGMMIHRPLFKSVLQAMARTEQDIPR